MVLDVHKFVVFFDPPECVTAEAALLAASNSRAMVRGKHHPGVIAFRTVCKQVGERIVVQQEVLCAACLRADNVWTLDRVSAEENREIQANDSVVALACIEFDRKATRVSC